MKDILKSFQKSLSRFKQALNQRETMITRDASILRFEFTFELAWKCAQKTLREEQIVCQSPKSCFQEAMTANLIQDDPQWICMLEDRNLAVHSYDEKLAMAIYYRLPNYVPLFEDLYASLKHRK